MTSKVSNLYVALYKNYKINITSWHVLICSIV